MLAGKGANVYSLANAGGGLPGGTKLTRASPFFGTNASK
jgi:hypothetical protein